MRRPPRLTSEDWLRIGFEALSKNGFSALKADVLSKEQSVTRGSFYHHFKDVSDFHSALIARWREVATEQIISGLDALRPGREALRALILLAYDAVDSLERQMRFWAESDTMAASAIREVDLRRVDYIRCILVEMNINPYKAVVRAEIIYDAYIGYCWRREAKSEALDDLVEELLRFAEG